MQKVSIYFEHFLKFGIKLVHSPSHDFIHLKYEGRFICGSFWALCCIKFCKGEIDLDVEPIVQVLQQCESSTVYDGECILAFRQFKDPTRYIPNVVSTLYACQLSFVLERTLFNIEHVVSYLIYLQRSNGGFRYSLEKHCETNDIRHSMCAVAALVICLKLQQKDSGPDEIATYIDVDALVKFVKRHFNIDGGVALNPGLESHGGAAFCAVGILTLIGKLDEIPKQRQSALQCWLLSRLSICGGASGRVGKRLDLCYVWWNLAALHLLGKATKLVPQRHIERVIRYIFKCQDTNGGLRHTLEADTEEDVIEADPWHTFTGFASMLLVHQEFLKKPLVPLALNVALAVPEAVKQS